MNAPHITRRSLAVIDALAWPAMALGAVVHSVGLNGPLLLAAGIWTLLRLNAALENRRLSYRLAFPVLGFLWVVPAHEFGGGPYRFTTLRLLWWIACGAIIYAVFGVAYLILGR
jgi:hypothetical protein